jgi:cystathionine gamma-synthase
VSLPTWSAVVGYEEGKADVVSALSTGYPRFVYHPYVVHLMDTVLELHANRSYKEDCLVLPSPEAASRCQAFLQQCLEGSVLIDNAFVDSKQNLPEEDDVSSRIRQVQVHENTFAVLFPATTEAGVAAKAYWQHTGEITTSRRAEYVLTQLGRTPRKCVIQNASSSKNIRHSSFATNGNSISLLQQRISEFANVPKENVTLVPSGMAALYSALRSARRCHFESHPASGPKGGGKSIVFGFPYLDTLKLCNRPELCPAGVEFFGRGDETDMQKLERMLRSSPPNHFSVLFTEVPSNPLLVTPDLFKLRELADEFNFCLVVDDTIANFSNVDVLSTGLADAVCTSLTKLISGRGDAIAGSVVANPGTERGRWMANDLTQHADQGLFASDAQAIYQNSLDFPNRSARINATAEKLADWLAEQPEIDRVYYPKCGSALYRRLMRANGGFGGLMSIILDSHMCQRNFYDALDVAKGPSLGTNFTLTCPYTLLAHYHELDFAMSYNVPPNLLRISVGLEDFEILRDKFSSALHMSRLHPKISHFRMASP